MKFCTTGCQQRARPKRKRDRAAYMQTYRKLVRHGVRVTPRKKTRRAKQTE